jgi:lupeol synthase 2
LKNFLKHFKFLQSFGSQLWDTVFAIQALLACDLSDETDDVLRKGHSFIKKSQVRENPSGDFKSMYRHISKGAWTLSDRDHGWQVSDCTAEALKVIKLVVEAELVKSFHKSYAPD